jgi:urease accessory protein
MKNSTSSRLLPLTVGLLLLPLAVQAHPGHSHAGFVAGAAHPLSGLDHLLAMIAVGLWAVQLGGRALWAVPASFVSIMVAGGALGMAGLPLPGVEQGILASVFVLGLLIATAARVPLYASMLIVGAFALFHGFAHGAEMPATAAGLGYGAGFAVATALLHAVGIGAGLLLGKLSAAAQPALAEGARGSWLRYAGGLIFAGGGAMAMGWI